VGGVSGARYRRPAEIAREILHAIGPQTSSFAHGLGRPQTSV
jgi:hypothetical protein